MLGERHRDQRFSRPVDHGDWHRCVGCRLQRSFAHVGLRLSGDELRHVRPVVLEVQTGADAELDYPSGYAGKVLAPVVGVALSLDVDHEARQKARPDRMADLRADRRVRRRSRLVRECLPHRAPPS